MSSNCALTVQLRLRWQNIINHLPLGALRLSVWNPSLSNQTLIRCMPDTCSHLLHVTSDSSHRPNKDFLLGGEKQKAKIFSLLPRPSATVIVKMLLQESLSLPFNFFSFPKDQLVSTLGIPLLPTPYIFFFYFFIYFFFKQNSWTDSGYKTEISERGGRK